MILHIKNDDKPKLSTKMVIDRYKMLTPKNSIPGNTVWVIVSATTKGSAKEYIQYSCVKQHSVQLCKATFSTAV